MTANRTGGVLGAGLACAAVLVFALAAVGCGSGEAQQGTSAATTAGTAEPGGWRHLGPEGGPALGLAIDPTQPSTLYAASWDGVFKSTDGGSHWRLSAADLGGQVVLALAPSDPQTLYAGDAAASTGQAALASRLTVTRTTDGGATWTAAGSGLPETASVDSLAVEPRNAGIVYAGVCTPHLEYSGCDGAIFRTEDGGASWEPTAALPRSYGSTPRADVLTIEPNSPATVYAATTDGVFKTTDGGGHWTESNRGLGESMVYTLAIDSSRFDVLRAGTGEGLFTSTDAGRHWTRTGLSKAWVIELVVDPESPRGLYALTDKGLFRSRDGGASWTPTGLRSPAYRIAVDPLQPRTIYAGSLDRGVLKSTDAGASWHPAVSGFTAPVGTTVAVDPRSPGTLYLGTAFGGLVRSADAGATWRPANSGLKGGFGLLRLPMVSTVVPDPASMERAYAGTSEGLYVTDDAGSSWREIAIDAHSEFGGVSAVALDPSDPKRLYVARTGPSGMAASADGGKTWHEIESGLDTANDFNALAVDPKSPKTLYVGTDEGGVYKSVDRGDGWQPARMGLPCSSEGSMAKCSAYVWALAVDPESPERVYAATSEGVFRSANGAGSWERASDGLPAGGDGHAAVVGLLVDPRSSSTLYAATASGVYRSDDGAGSWSRVADGPSHKVVLALALDPEDSTLYATTVGGLSARSVGEPEAGSKASGTTPAAPTPPVSLANAHVFALAIDPRDPKTVYAGSDGLFKSSDGGKTWHAAGLGNERLIESITIDPTRPDTLYAVSLEGDVFKSTDAAATWRLAVNCPSCDPGFHQASSVAVDPQHAQTLYAGAFGDLFKSTDGGATWAPSSTGLPGTPGIDAVAVDPTDPRIVYAAGGRGEGAASMWKSTNGGASWKRATVGLEGVDFVGSLAIDPAHPERVYAGTAGPDAYRSSDGGATWHPMHVNDMAAEPVVVDPADPDVLYSPREGTQRLARSTDTGKTWHPFGPKISPSVETIAVSPDGKVVYAGTQGGGVVVIQARP